MSFFAVFIVSINLGLGIFFLSKVVSHDWVMTILFLVVTIVMSIDFAAMNVIKLLQKEQVYNKDNFGKKGRVTVKMNAISKFEPKTLQSFWCSVCVGKIVRSNDKSTGQFYAVHGDVWNAKKQDMVNGYERIVMPGSTCAQCQKNKTEK